MYGFADDEVEAPYFTEEIFGVRSGHYGLAFVDTGSVVGCDADFCQTPGRVCGPFSVKGGENGVGKEAAALLLKVVVQHFVVRACGQSIA